MHIRVYNSRTQADAVVHLIELQSVDAVVHLIELQSKIAARRLMLLCISYNCNPTLALAIA